MKDATRWWSASRRLEAETLGILVATAVLAFTHPADAQTWVGGRTTPRLGEIVAIDHTGEPWWPFPPPEDILGDGLNNFTTPEQRLDMRTAYAATDAQRFWTRVYVVARDMVSAGVRVFVFIDTDNNPMTGGSAAAAAVNARFTTDPTAGGYERVLEIDATGAVLHVWSWQQAMMTFTSAVPTKPQMAGEAGKDVDPATPGAWAAGYVEAQIDLAIAGLTTACDARLFYRSVNTADPPHSDIDIGVDGPCKPAAGADGVPAILIPPMGCMTDMNCPAQGVCDNGTCVLPAPCLVATDCGAGFMCTPDGRCVPNPGGACMVQTDCGKLACVNGQCVACTPGSTNCGAGLECTPQGTCVVGVGGTGGNGAGGGIPHLLPGQRVQGGALACDVERSPSADAGGAPAASLFFACAGLALHARRRRTKPARALPPSQPRT
jgi:hypothetical protein